MDLQTPSVLAQLPRPLDASDGKIWFGEVFSVVGSKKRRRYEIAAAVDGAVVNIYNVQFPKLVASYAISPLSSFSCSPCSVWQKSAQSFAVKQQTYCAIEKPEKQIRCFLDQSDVPGSQGTGISTSSFRLENSDGLVAFLGIIAASPENHGLQEFFDVIAVHRNGRIRRLAPDLGTQRWSILPNIETAQSTKYEVQASFLVAFEDARKSLFRKRQDIVATVLGNALSAGSDTSSILMLISYPSDSKALLPSDVQVHIFSLPAHVPIDDFALSQAQYLRHLATINLPNLDGQEPLLPQNIRWSFHSGSAGLLLTIEKGFINYDLSQYSPEISSYFLLQDERFSSVMRISPRSVIGAGESSVAIYNTRYQSIQANIFLSEVPSSRSARFGDCNLPIEFISYFSKLRTAVAVRGTTLLNFDFTSVNGSRVSSTKRPGYGLLINAVGRGIESAGKRPSELFITENAIKHILPVGLTSKEDAAPWSKLKTELDILARANDALKFDHVVKSKFTKVSVPYIDSTARALPSSKRFVDPEKIFFLLSKIFRFQAVEGIPPASKLSISFLPKETFEWLANSNHLTLSNIQIALRQSTGLRVPPIIPSGALVHALSEFDRSMKLLLLVLRSPVVLDAAELVHTLKILLKAARSQSTSPNDFPKSLVETPHVAKEDERGPAPITNKSLHGVLTSTISGLNLALTRLDSHPLEKVVQSIRAVLSNSDTLSIIHHLRHSLATGGYTSRFTEEPPPSFSSPEISPLSLPTIVGLLTACVDAVGPSGWISVAGFSGGDGSEACLIADMKSEVSAVLAGVEEATYLKGILREFIRYAETAVSTTSNDHRHCIGNQPAEIRPGERIKRKERQNDAEILIYDDGDEGEGTIGGISSDVKMLPLPLRMSVSQDGSVRDEKISKTKIRKSTGEVRNRSNREIRYLKRKAVGKYSFERIIV